jgi:hypothetical protein
MYTYIFRVLGGSDSIVQGKARLVALVAGGTIPFFVLIHILFVRAPPPTQPLLAAVVEAPVGREHILIREHILVRKHILFA